LGGGGIHDEALASIAGAGAEGAALLCRDDVLVGTGRGSAVVNSTERVAGLVASPPS